MNNNSNNWDESKHPRDDEGKFTFKGQGTSNPNDGNAVWERRANTFYPDMEDKKKSKGGVLTGGATPIDYIENNLEYQKYCIAIDGIGLKSFRDKAIKEYGIETAENLYMSKTDSYLNTEYAKQHLVLNNYKSLSGSLKNYFKEKITEQLILQNSSEKYILDNIKGIYIESSSDSSKRMAKALLNEPDFLKIISENKQNILKGKSVESSINFKNKNFYYALGKADIKNIKLNKNGDIILLVTDVYDFNKKSDSMLIKAGRKRQEEGKIMPYFIIYDVVIPKDYL